MENAAMGLWNGMLAFQRNGLALRMAETEADLHAAQRLRYQVFYEECGATPTDVMRATRRDADRYDAICDHLLVIEQGRAADDGTDLADGRLIGTYRLLRQDVAAKHGGFYSESEFNLAPLLQRHANLRFLEVGRSCVAQGFRGKPTAELLWQGIWNYVRIHAMDVMLGCASLEGTDIDQLADQLSFIANTQSTPEQWTVAALPQRYVSLQQKPGADVDQRAMLRRLPTLIKAYMRLGCYIGDGAVIDHQFNTTDILIILPVADINPRYFNHYGEPLHQQQAIPYTDEKTDASPRYT
jgi:L-ornithine Nalpha-acyltransferase